MCGLINENMMATGREIKCMVEVKQFGLMEDLMLESKKSMIIWVDMKMIKNMGLEHFNGVTEGNILVNGKRANSMVEELLKKQLENLVMENGLMDEELNGLMKAMEKMIESYLYCLI